MDIDLGPVDRITTDAVGPPGERTFFIQARKGDRVVTVLVEKQQVQLLAASVVEILARIGKETGEAAPEEAMGLEEPVLPEWRVGRLSIGYEEVRDLLILEAEELVPGEDDDNDDEGDEEHSDDQEHETAVTESLGDPEDPVEVTEPGRVRLWATREQMLSFAQHGAAVCARGRPTCRFCDQPLDPEGHVCPAMNGHRTADAE